MLTLYFVTLAASSGVVGAFLQRELALEGYVASFGGGVSLACGSALGYLAIQLLYMSVVRLLKPTRDNAPLFCELLSLASAGALIPSLLGVHFLGSDPAMLKYEPLGVFGVFAALHVIFKLASFFATLWAAPSSRLNSALWLLAAAIAGATSFGLITRWTSTLEAALQRAPDEMQAYRIGTDYAVARIMPEGAIWEQPLKTFSGQSLTMRWARPPNSDEDAQGPQTFYVNVAIDGAESRTISKSVTLKGPGWVEARIPALSIPAGAETCSISWTSEKDPQWRKLVKYRPVIASRRQLLMSGPFSHETRGDSTSPNFVVILVDGLGDGSAGPARKRDTTPALDHLAAAALSFAHAYTPAPDSAAAVMTTLTGVSPLRHGFLGSHRGPLPEAYKTLPSVLGQQHYVTAAFTEADGDSPTVMAYATGFEKGFETYDTGYAADGAAAAPQNSTASKSAAEPLAGSQVTLNRARAWIDAHNDEKFFVLIRLRELTELAWRSRYAPGLGKGGAEAAPLDTYDSAVAFLDRKLGELFTHLREKELRKNTCVLVTSTHGYDFSMGAGVKPIVNLSEDALSVPLVFLIPGVEKAPRHDVVSLLDIMPSVLKLAGALEDVATEGTDFVNGPNGAQPISVWGDPLQISVRTEKWRFTWQTVVSPFKQQLTAGSGAVELFEASQLKRGAIPRSVAARVPDAVIQFRRGLDTYITRCQQGWKTKTEETPQ